MAQAPTCVAGPMVICQRGRGASPNAIQVGWELMACPCGQEDSETALHEKPIFPKGDASSHGCLSAACDASLVPTVRIDSSGSHDCCTAEGTVRNTDETGTTALRDDRNLIGTQACPAGLFLSTGCLCRRVPVPAPSKSIPVAEEYRSTRQHEWAMVPLSSPRSLLFESVRENHRRGFSGFAPCAGLCLLSERDGVLMRC